MSACTHDWKLHSHSQEGPGYGGTGYKDTWYCPRCRLVEERVYQTFTISSVELEEEHVERVFRSHIGETTGAQNTESKL